MDEQVNPLERDHSLSVVLPGGLEKNATVHGSKPVMDLLVTLCASYHLNPSDYTVEVLSPNKNNINFKPNSLIGSLEAEKIVLKPKGTEEKIRRPYMPEASVRLLINYNKSHKAVVRVNPRVPLEALLPVVCDKCEFQVETTVLLRDSESTEPLDLTKTLNDHGLREVFAKDTAGKEPIDHQHQPKTPEAAVTPTEVISPPPLQDLPKKEKKQKENTGLLSLFRRRKKKAEREGARSAPASPSFNKEGGVNNNGQGVSSSNTLPTDMPKKRRAPQPPMGVSQSVPNNLGTCHIAGSQRSEESTLKRTKRRAPPPPCANSHQELQADTEVEGTVNSLNTVEELRDSEESDYINFPLSSSSSPHPSHPRSSSCRPSFAHLHEVADPYLPSFRGKDLSDARSALAKILTSSVSKGTLVKRLSNSATFSKLHTGPSCMSATQRGADNGVYCAKLEPVVTANLPTENEWEDPVQRKGMTTFKVVPSKKPKSHDSEVTPDKIAVEDNLESEDSPTVGINPAEREEDLCCPDRLEAETPPQSPEPSSLQTSDRSLSLPTPLDVDHLDSPGSPLTEADEKQEEEDEPEDATEVTAAAPSDCGDGELTSDVQINSDDQIEFQSLSGHSVRTDADHCGSYTGEREVEEEVPQKEDNDEKEVEEEAVQEEDDSEKVVEEEVVQEDEKVFEDEVVQEEDDDEKVFEDEVVQEEDDDEKVVEEEVVQEEDDNEKVVEEEVVEEEDDDEKVVEEEVVQEKEDFEREVMVQEEDEDEDSFPPPPPPVFFDTEVMDEQREQTTASSLPSSLPPSPTSNGQSNAFSEDQSAAAPKPLDKMSAAPSRFAQAVALAVQRSRLQSHGKGLGPQAPSGPHSTLPSPPRSAYQYGA